MNVPGTLVILKFKYDYFPDDEPTNTVYMQLATNGEVSVLAVCSNAKFSLQDRS